MSVVFAWIAAGLLAGTTSRAEEEPKVLTRVEEIRELSREDAEKGLPVRLRGVVIYRAAGSSFFNVHDGTQSATVQLFRAFDRKIWAGGKLPATESEPGAVIEIEGITGSAGYSPVIIPIRFKRVGTEPLPPPLRTTMERLISGSLVSQRVQIEGIVQRAVRFRDGRFELNVMAGGHLCLVSLLDPGDLVPEQLVDARVLLRGCSNPGFNLRSEAINIRLLCQNAADLDVLEAPLSDPFQAPHVPINQLLPFSPKLDRYHRKVTEGIVNFVLPGQFFFIQEGTTGVRVDSSSAAVQVGDRVEVAGFVETSRTFAAMRDAVARTVARDVPPRVETVTLEQILQPEIADPRVPVSEMDFSGRLVRLQGVIDKIEKHEDDDSFRLLVSSGERIFSAFLGARDQTDTTTWQEGAKIEVTGVCELEFTAPGSIGRKSADIAGLKLWLRSPEDIKVLAVPSWWTPRRLAFAAGGLGVVLSLALAWGVMLRRQVLRQMEVISGRLRYEAVSEERNRIARDLHDTLEQQLVGVALQLDGAEKVIHKANEPALESVRLAGRMLRHTRMEARRSVWDLRSQVLELEGLAAALRALGANSGSSAGTVVEVQVTGETRKLPLRADFQILSIAQEALANALKHAHAKHIVISLESTAVVTRLSVLDDGCGFTPDMLERTDLSHFGVLGMQERAGKIGAELAITGTPGAGCLVSLTLPFQTAKTSIVR
jgi:signal transduction histidine kinase